MKMVMFGPPPASAPQMISAKPSAFITGCYVHAAGEIRYRKKLRMSCVSAIVNVDVGPPPGPGPVMMSGMPSPLTSPAATRTPPVKFGS